VQSSDQECTPGVTPVPLTVGQKSLLWVSISFWVLVALSQFINLIPALQVLDRLGTTAKLLVLAAAAYGVLALLGAASLLRARRIAVTLLALVWVAGTVPLVMFVASNSVLAMDPFAVASWILSCVATAYVFYLARIRYLR
jgi:hypothetical protein